MKQLKECMPELVKLEGKTVTGEIIPGITRPTSIPNSLPIRFRPPSIHFTRGARTLGHSQPDTSPHIVRSRESLAPFFAPSMNSATWAYSL